MVKGKMYSKFQIYKKSGNEIRIQTNKVIKEIWEKSMRHSSFSKLAAPGATFFKKAINLFLDMVLGSACSKHIYNRFVRRSRTNRPTHIYTSKTPFFVTWIFDI